MMNVLINLHKYTINSYKLLNIDEYFTHPF